jgi:hypothetical protein
MKPSDSLMNLLLVWYVPVPKISLEILPCLLPSLETAELNLLGVSFLDGHPLIGSNWSSPP